MTPQQFAGAYLHTAQLVTAGTGIDAFVLLAQWANETDWGNVVVGNNLGNIRCSPTTFCQYATLDDFAQACIATFHNGYYGAVLAAVGPAAQLAAIVASPWDSGHYGGSLQAFYTPLEAFELTPEEHDKLEWLYVTLGQIYYAGKNAAGAPNWPNWDALMAAVTANPAGATDLTPVLAAIADLKAHPAAIADPSVLAIVTRIETALKAA